MQTQEPFLMADFTNGVIDDLSVADSLLPKNSVRKGINVVFDRPRGSITSRYGTTQVGSTMSATVLGLHNFRSSNTANNQLLTASGGNITYLTGGSFVNTVTGLTSGLRTRFLTYLDSVVFLNGTDAVQSWTGAGAWINSGGNLDVGGFPRGKYAAILNTRIQVAGVSGSPDTVYESSLESGGAISWSSGNRNFRVNPNDGNGNITGIKSNGSVSIIFKERGMYRYDGNSLQNLANIGTPSNESIINDDNGVTYFFGAGANGVGFYFTTAGYPSKISRPITRWVEAIASSYYGNVAGITNGVKILWFVGSITIGGITYANAMFVWNIADKSWEIRNYADTFRVMSSYILSDGSYSIVGGDTDFMVQTLDSGTTDNGTPIYAECEMAPLHIVTRGVNKVINEIVTYAEHFQGLKLLLKIDRGVFQSIGSIDENEKLFSNLDKFRGHTFYFKITASNSGTPFKFDGLEIPNITIEEYR